MNTAAKAISGTWGLGNRRLAGVLQLTREGLIVWSLVVMIALTSLALIYVKTANRQLFSQLQIAQQEHDGAQLRWSQLLLEQSTWATQARIETVAHRRLGMELPRTRHLIVA